MSAVYFHPTFKKILKFVKNNSKCDSPSNGFCSQLVSISFTTDQDIFQRFRIIDSFWDFTHLICSESVESHYSYEDDEDASSTDLVNSKSEFTVRLERNFLIYFFAR